MEDYNDPQKPQDVANGQPGDVHQAQPGNTTESTYWETQSQPMPKTPEQFYTYYQEQMNSKNSFTQAGEQPRDSQINYTQPIYTQQNTPQPGYQAGTYYQQPKKKSHRALAAVLVILFLLTGTATAYAFRTTLLNSFASLTKSPVEYYAFIEKNAISKSVDDVKPYLGLATQNSAYNVKSDLSINRETVDSLLQSSMDMSLSDLEGEIGVPLESLGLSMFYGRRGNILNEKLGVRFNQVDLITMEFFMDTAAKNFFMRFPELSKAYINFSGEDLNSSIDFSKIEIPTTDQTVNFLNKYSNIIVDNISQVEKENNYELKLKDLSMKCTKLTVTITENDFNNISKAILEEAKNDDYIINLLPMFEMTKLEYQQEIDRSLEELKTSTTDINDGSLKMIVYADNNGNIIGRELSSDNSKSIFAYTLLTNGHNEEYNINFKDNDGTELFNVSGNQTKDNGAYDGKATISIVDTSQTYFDNLTLDVTYEDISSQYKNNRFYQSGKFSISSAALGGLQITSENTVKDNNQYNKLDLMMGASTLATITTTLEYLDDYKVEMPPDSAEVYKSSQIDSYQATVDTEKFIKELSDKLGVDLQGLLDSYGNLFGNSYENY